MNGWLFQNVRVFKYKFISFFISGWCFLLIYEQFHQPSRLWVFFCCNKTVYFFKKYLMIWTILIQMTQVRKRSFFVKENNLQKFCYLSMYVGHFQLYFFSRKQESSNKQIIIVFTFPIGKYFFLLIAKKRPFNSFSVFIHLCYVTSVFWSKVSSTY